MNAHDILVKVRDEILTDESRWTKDKISRDAAGNAVFAKDPTAICWCLIGAVDRADGIGSGAGRFIREALPATFSEDMVAFNNAPATTFSDIRDLLDRAIEIAKGGVRHD